MDLFRSKFRYLNQCILFISVFRMPYVKMIYIFATLSRRVHVFLWHTQMKCSFEVRLNIFIYFHVGDRRYRLLTSRRTKSKTFLCQGVNESIFALEKPIKISEFNISLAQLALPLSLWYCVCLFVYCSYSTVIIFA